MTSSAMSFLDRFKAWRLERRRARKFARRRAFSAGLDVESAFDKIYQHNKWGKSRNGTRFYSGNGSLPEHSQLYEDFVVDFIQSHPAIQSWGDIGCGDFQVAGRILSRLGDRPIRYTGYDAARSVVAYNTEHFSRPGVEFVAGDAASGDLGRADLITVRQVLQHLSNQDIQRILKRVSESCSTAIIAESLPLKLIAPNLDIEHGIAVRVHIGSGVYLDQPPFNMQVASAVDHPFSDKEFVRTSVLTF